MLRGRLMDKDITVSITGIRTHYVGLVRGSTKGTHASRSIQSEACVFHMKMRSARYGMGFLTGILDLCVLTLLTVWTWYIGASELSYWQTWS